jgi:hypothetical protein
MLTTRECAAAGLKPALMFKDFKQVIGEMLRYTQHDNARDIQVA